jgi:HPt (histidine-containing phosphotransfer) domain-containing protein
MMVDPVVFDLAEALNRSLGDVEFLHMLMNEFQSTLPEFISSMETALHDGCLEEMGRQAHQLKGAAANLGTKALAGEAFELEKIGTSGRPAGAAEALQRLKTAVQELNHVLGAIDWSMLSRH